MAVEYKNRTWRVYRELINFVDAHGYVPSFRELAERCGCSASTVKRHMDELMRLGLVQKKARSARGIVIKYQSELAESE